jgi:hypothetical protein
MRSSRAMRYAERLSELSSQLLDLEDLRKLVEDAERSARRAPTRLTYALRRPRTRELSALSVRLRRHAGPIRHAELSAPREQHSPADWISPPFPEGWWASP